MYMAKMHILVAILFLLVFTPLAHAGTLSEDVEQFRKENPAGFAALCRNIAAYYHKKGDLERTLAWTERILELQPENYQTQVYKAQLLFGIKRYAECEALLKDVEGKELLKESPLLVTVRNLLYRAYKAQDKLSGQERRIEKKLKARKVDADTYRQAFMMFRISEDYDKTIKYAKKAVRAYPDESSFRFALAYAYEKQGKVKAAIKEYRALIDKHPANVNAYNQLLNMLKENKRLKEARKLWVRYVKKDEKNLYKRFQLVDILSTAGNFDDALAQLDLIQKAHPNNPQVLTRVKRYRDSIVQKKQTQESQP